MPTHPPKMLMISLLALLLTQTQPSHAQEKEESIQSNAQFVTQDERISGDKLLAAQVNAIAVLNMIKSLEVEMEGITKGIDKGNEKIETLKKQIKEEENVTESTTENVTEEVTTLQTGNMDINEATQRPLIVQKQSKKKKEDKINRLTLALRNLSERSRFLKDAIKEQRKLLQVDISTLRKLRRKHLKKQKKIPKTNPVRKQKPESQLRNPSKSTENISVNNEKRKLIKEWRNIEKNSLLLGNTAKAFLAQLEANEKKKISKTAAQVVPTDDNISFDIDDPSILALDDPSVLIEEEEEKELEDSEYDYPEIIYDIESEDDVVDTVADIDTVPDSDTIPDIDTVPDIDTIPDIEPGIDVEYELEFEDDFIPEIEIEYEIEDYEYEDSPVVLTVPRPIPPPPIRPAVIQPDILIPTPHNVHYRPRPHYPQNNYYRPSTHHSHRPQPHYPQAHQPNYPHRPKARPYPAYPRYPQPNPNPPHITLTGSLAKHHRLAVPEGGHGAAFSDILG